LQDSFITGLAIVLAAGLFQGSFMFPGKYMKNWQWENYWIIFAIVAYLISPWLLAFATVPHLGQVYAGTSPGTYAIILVFGLAWGLGALSFGLGVEAVGLSLGFAVILGVAASAGAVIPLIVNPPQHITAAQIALTSIAIVIMLAGVWVCSFAGRWKESSPTTKRQSYAAGIALCIGSGLLSSCGNLGFVFGSDVASLAQRLGTPSHLAGNAVWTLLAIPLFLCNAGYSAVLLIRNRTVTCYSAPGSGLKGSLALSMGAMWMAGMSLYGIGSRSMGPLGASVGWAVLMSSMVLTANVLGMSSGEWAGAPPRSRRLLIAGLALLLIAIAALGYTNQLALDAGA
jgi:L-rhamnose-H+ transport protein